MVDGKKKKKMATNSLIKMGLTGRARWKEGTKTRPWGGNMNNVNKLPPYLHFFQRMYGGTPHGFGAVFFS